MKKHNNKNYQVDFYLPQMWYSRVKKKNFFKKNSLSKIQIKINQSNSICMQVFKLSYKRFIALPKFLRFKTWE